MFCVFPEKSSLDISLNRTGRNNIKKKKTYLLWRTSTGRFGSTGRLSQTRLFVYLNNCVMSDILQVFDRIIVSGACNANHATAVIKNILEIIGWNDRPKKRWRNDLDAYCNGWSEVALENTTWKDVGWAFAQLWNTKSKIKKKLEMNWNARLKWNGAGHVSRAVVMAMDEGETAEKVPSPSAGTLCS